MDMITLAMAKAYSDSKGGYEEKKYYSPTVTVPFMESPYPGIYTSEPIFNLADATPGDILTVVWDDTEYKAEVGVSNGGINCIGNPVFEGGEDNGLPFVFAPIYKNGNFVGLAILTFDTSASHTVTVYCETIVPIDQKYLPGVCLPVVELSVETVMSAFDSGGEPVPVTAEEIAALEAVKNSGNAIIIRCITGDNGSYACGLCSADYDSVTTQFYCRMFAGGMKLDVIIGTHEGNGWTMTAVVVD